jgi:hypothetical protein
VAKYFEKLAGGILYGKELVTSGSCSPGHVMALSTGGSVVAQCGTSGCPFGMEFGTRFIYTPTSMDSATGEKLAVVQGDFLILISGEFFDTGSIPSSPNTPLYVYTGGLLKTSGTTKIGQFIKSVSVTQPGGSSQSVAMCRMNIAAA